MQISHRTYDAKTRSYVTEEYEADRCPFCGVDGEQCLEVMVACPADRLDEEHAAGKLAVWCGNCGAVGPTRETQAEAVAAWNCQPLVRVAKSVTDNLVASSKTSITMSQLRFTIEIAAARLMSALSMAVPG